MSLERGLTRVHYLGDSEAAKGKLFNGMLVLNGVREQLRLSQTGLKQYRMERRFADGTIIQAVSSYGQEQINIYCPPRVNIPIPRIVEEVLLIMGFICHPRSDTFPGGRTPAGEPIIAVYSYPLVDDDHGSVVVSPKWALSTPVENYGNIDWLDSGGSATSWRGPASRSFAMDSLINYSGFTIFDYETLDIFPVTHYTPYQNLVYRGGEVALEYPTGCKVLGATDIYTVLGIDYVGGINPDGGTGGFYTEVWQGLAKRIGWLCDSRPTTPWFFNQSGNAAVNKNNEIVIDTASGVLAQHPLGAGAGTETRICTPGHIWGLTRDGSFSTHYDYVGDILANINLIVRSSDSSLITSEGKELYADIPIYYSGVQATALTITGPDAYGGPGAYTATLYPPGSGDCGGPVIWTYPTGCGMQNVTARQGDVTGSMQVRMPTGVWTLVLHEQPDPSCCYYTCQTTVISGDTKLVRSFMPPFGDRVHTCTPTETRHCYLVDDSYYRWYRWDDYDPGDFCALGGLTTSIFHDNGSGLNCTDHTAWGITNTAMLCRRDTYTWGCP